MKKVEGFSPAKCVNWTRCRLLSLLLQINLREPFCIHDPLLASSNCERFCTVGISMLSQLISRKLIGKYVKYPTRAIKATTGTTTYDFNCLSPHEIAYTSSVWCSG